ncbi:MAG: tetratricopeptide repeat protein [Campylobacterota bacterium]
MDIVQIIMLATAAGVGFMIYKQIDSGNFQQVRKDSPQNSDRPAPAPGAEEKIQQSKEAKQQYKQQRVQELLDKTDELVANENFTEAQKSIEAALILEENSDNYMRQGFILQNLDNKEAAIQSFENAIKFDSQNDLAYTFIGQLQTELGAYEKAREAFEKALEIDSEYGKTHIAYATMLFKAKEYDKSRQHLQKAKELDGENEEIEQLEHSLKEAIDEKN